MLCEKSRNEKPESDFLVPFSEVLGSKWPSLAVSLALREVEIVGLKEKVGLSQQEHALQMLKIWISRDEATYSNLYQKLKTISLFQYSK